VSTFTSEPKLKSLKAVYIRRDENGNDIEYIPLGIIAGEDYDSNKHKIKMAVVKALHPKWAKEQKILAEEMKRNGSRD
jgi:diphthamide synthase (EF-2-diphthine--ammonia ligase)